MTPHDLIAAFDVMAEAPDGVDRLREFVIQLAVRGRLVPQDPADEPANVLLKRIEAVKARLAAAGVIPQQQSVPPIAHDDFPWDVPSGWTWTNTAAIGVLSPRYVADNDATVVFAPMSVIPTEFRETIRPEQRRWGDIKKAYTHFADGDVVVAKITPCFQNRKSCVMEGIGGIGAGSSELHVVSPVAGTVSAKYLLLFYKSPGFIDSGIARMTGTAGQQRVPSEFFANTPLPLPPLAEQQRIVGRVHELMGLLDRLENARKTREAMRAAVRDSVLDALRAADTADGIGVAWTRFAERRDDLVCDPADVAPLRETVLQLAVRGRLVPQDPRDEAASVLLERVAADRAATVAAKLTRMGDDPGGYDEEDSLPVGWKWAPLQDVVQFIDYRGKTPPKAANGVRLITAKNIRDGYIGDEPREFVSPGTYESWMKRGFPRNGDVLFTTEAPMGKAALVAFPERFALAQRAINLHPYADLAGRYIMWMLLSPWFQERLRKRATGMTAMGIKGAKLRLIRVPIPPLCEQHRIVARVDELMGLLGRLEARLTAARIAHGAFAAAAVHGALAVDQLPAVAGTPTRSSRPFQLRRPRGALGTTADPAARLKTSTD